MPSEPQAKEGGGVPDESGLRRAMAHSEQGKFRVTYGAAQAVLGHFGEDEKEIKGVVLPGALLVSGVHAKLSSVDEGG